VRSTTLDAAEIELPPEFRDVVIAPGAGILKAPSKSGTAMMITSSVNGKMILNAELETSPAIISPQDYPAILKVESTLKKKSSNVVLLKKP